MSMIKGASITDLESLQLALHGVHSEARRIHNHHIAAIRANVAHRWPITEAWLLSEIRRSDDGVPA